MPQSLTGTLRIFQEIRNAVDPETFARRLAPILPADKPLPPRLPGGREFSRDALDRRRSHLEGMGFDLAPLGDPGPEIPPETLKGNIENLVGFCRIPVGVIGPLRINGVNAHDDFFIPMATTEGALIASYNRGARVISESGGAAAICLTDIISRAPCFLFDRLSDAGLFLNWVLPRFDRFAEIAAGTTRHGILQDMKVTLNGPAVFLNFEYATGDASGQNMVTVATEAICRHIEAASPITPGTWYLEGNLSGDKKASMLSFLGARGKKVVTEAVLPAAVVRNLLHTTPERMAEYCRISTLAAIQSGTIGTQGHVANALAAIFIACGQDAACVSEASVGMTDMHVGADGALRISLSLPNLTVGTVGGGTHLPGATACLGMMGCAGAGKARKFAEICAAAALAGEISIVAALSAGHFASAHATYRHKGR